MVYNKLVRDKIPEIIKATGKLPICRTLTDSEFPDALNIKLQEEMAEYLESGSIEELCDILEVAYAIAANKGFTPDDIADIRDMKNNKNGTFNKKIFLEKVVDPTEVK